MDRFVDHSPRLDPGDRSTWPSSRENEPASLIDAYVELDDRLPEDAIDDSAFEQLDDRISS